jgi:sec-independent protein translocase protein TatA
VLTGGLMMEIVFLQSLLQNYPFRGSIALTTNAIQHFTTAKVRSPKVSKPVLSQGVKRTFAGGSSDCKGDVMFSAPELAVVLVIVLVLFGPKKLPDIGASLGKGIRDFKKAFEDEPPKVSHEAASADKPPSP